LKGGVLGGAVAAGMAIFLITAHLLRCEEATDVVALIRKKVFRK
jgi:putative peptidoglycan lipid II flippase